MSDIKTGVLNVLNEMGIYVQDIPLGLTDEPEQSKDIDLREYLIDSLMFIVFIVEIEKKFNTEFPEDLLLQETMSSMSGFINLLDEIINRKEDCCEEDIEKASS